MQVPKQNFTARDLSRAYLAAQSAVKAQRRIFRYLGWIFLLLTPISVAAGQNQKTSADGSHLRSAAQFLVRGDLPHAEEEVQAVLAASPQDYRALNLLGIIRAQQHRSEEAESIFRQVVTIAPDYAGVHVSLGLLYMETNRKEQAIDELELALKFEPGRQDAAKPLLGLLQEQAKLALREGSFEKSLSILIRARKIAPNNPELNYEFGMVALRMSLFEDARAAFEQVANAEPANANAIYGLARAQMGLARIPVARELLEKYVQLRPTDPTGHFGLGLVLHMLAMPDEARKQFERSIELQPEQTEAYVQMGFMDLEANELDRAAGQFGATLRRAPQNVGALLGMGRIQFQRKEYSKAAEFLESALARDASIREAHYYLGLTYARLGRSRESSEQMAMATTLERTDLDRQRIIMKLLDPAEAEALEKNQP